jgi:hypothetical protein
MFMAGCRSLGIDNILILTPPPVYEEGRKEWQVVVSMV